MEKRYFLKASSCLSGLGVFILGSIAPVSQAVANPEGGNVVRGDATISAAGNTLNIHQNSQKAVIDWRKFDIKAGETTQFHQPNSSSYTLNRVNANAGASQIDGMLKANGNIAIVNPNGVLFGAGSQVDVNGLVATTADVDNDRFMNDAKVKFDKPGNPNAGIVNNGTITAKEAGLVGLVAPNVVNNGVINAKLGRVQLASGDTTTVDLYGNGLLEVQVSDDVKSQIVHTGGQINADGGTIAITAAAGKDIVNSLITVQGELNAPTVGVHEGKIIIAAEGSNAVKGNVEADKGVKQGESNVVVQGALNVSGRRSGERGGSVEITGDNIALLARTTIDATGRAGKKASTSGSATLTADKKVKSEAEFLASDSRAGGSVKIGGDYLGKGETATAKNLFVDQYVLVMNDALESGDAGRTVFWSDGNTEFYGDVIARGGDLWGNGGFLETSGKEMLTAQGYADLTAVNGFKGTYLLDPANIRITSGITPASFSGLNLWLDASQITGVADGAAISSWTNLAGGVTVNQGNVTYQPVYIANGLNGRPVIRFTNDALPFSGNITSSGATAFTSSILWQRPTSVTHDALLISSGTNYNYLQYGDDWHVGENNSLIIPMADDTPYIKTSMVDSSVIYRYTNGLEHATQNANTTRWGFSGLGTNTFTFSGDVAEVYNYNRALTADELALLSQYQSVKWGVTLLGANAAAEASAAMNSTTGFSSFTTDYLEKLSQTADISLLATNTINLDFQGDALDLSGGRNITLTTTNGNIYTSSAGTINTSRVAGSGGNITMTAGGTGTMTFDHAFTLNAANGGEINLTSGGKFYQNANLTLKGASAATIKGSHLEIGSKNAGAVNRGDIIYDSNGTIDLKLIANKYISTYDKSSIYVNTVGGATGKINLTMNSNHDYSVGALRMEAGSQIRTNGGYVVMGGGADPWTEYTQGDGEYFSGIRITGSGANPVLIDASGAGGTGGNIVMNGKSNNTGGGAAHRGIYYQNTTVRTNGIGNITMNGIGTNGTATDNEGINLTNSQVEVEDGSILMVGTGGNGTSRNSGIHLVNTGVTSTASSATGGKIELIGVSGASSGNDNNFQDNQDGVVIETSSITSGYSDILIDGTGGNGAGARSRGVMLVNGGTVKSTGTGSDAADITINGAAGTGNNSSYAGVQIFNSSSTNTGVESIDGNIVLQGTSAPNSTSKSSVYLNTAGGTAASNTYVYSTGSGNVTLVGTVNDPTSQIQTNGPGNMIIGSLTGTGIVSLVADSISFATNTFLRSGGDVVMRPYTDGATVGIGNGAGMLQLTSWVLSKTTYAGTLWLGGGSDWAKSGIVTLNAAVNQTFNGNVNFVSGKSIAATGGTFRKTNAAGFYDWNFYAKENILFSNGADLIVDTGAGATGMLNITLNSNRANSGGAIEFGANSDIRSNGGDISFVGGSDGSGFATGFGTYARGIYLLGTNIINAAGGDITMRGQGGSLGLSSQMGIATTAGTQLITSGSGAISLTGTAAANTSTSSHIGVSLSGTTVKAENGDIYINGTGADANTNSRGVYIGDNSLIENIATSSTPAEITIIGQAGSIATAASGHQTGITINAGVVKSGYADIFIDGTSGSNAADYSRGVHIASGGEVSSTGTGADAANIDIKAYLLSAAGTDFLLQEQNSSTSSVNSIDGDIAVTAGTDTKGGALSINASTGANTSSIHSSGSGNVTLTAKGSTLSRGVIQSGSNATTLFGSATGSGVYQLIADTLDIKASSSFIHAGELVLRPYLSGTSVGIGTTSSTLQITDAILNKVSNASTLWLGGNQTWNNSGDVTVTSSATLNQNTVITSGNHVSLAQGARTLTTANNANLDIVAKQDVTTSSSGVTSTSGSGDLTVIAGRDINLSMRHDFLANGAGGDVTLRANRNIGVLNGGYITTQGGNITINSDYDQSTSAGGEIRFAGTQLTSNGGDIVLGGGANPLTTYAQSISTHAIIYQGGGISSGNGDISIRGRSVGSSNQRYGLSFGGTGVTPLTIESTGGNIFIEGRSVSSGEGGYGIYMGNSSAMSTVKSVDGDITINGFGSQNSSATGHGFRIANNSAIHSDNGDLYLTGYGNVANGQGVVATGSVAIGDANSTGNIYMQLDNWNVDSTNLIDFRTAGTLYLQNYSSGTTIGLGSGLGGLSIINDQLSRMNAGGLVFGSATAGDMNINSALTSPAHVTFLSGEDITLDSTLTINSANANALVIAAGGNFINNAGANALNTPNSRWLVYSADPTLNTRGGLLPTASDFGKTYATDAPATIGAGNRFIYATNTRPTIVAKVDDQSVTYGDAYSVTNTLSYVSGLISGDTISNIGLTGDATYSVTHALTDNAGFYAGAITATVGTLATALGYDFILNAGGLTVDKATLTVDVNDATREYGDINPVFTGSVTGWKNGQGLGDLTNGVSYTSAATQTTNAGTAVITANTGAETNYVFAVNDGTLTIDKATLTVDVNDATREYGDINPVFTGSVSGWKNGQGLGDLTNGVSYTSAATQTTNAGTAVITANTGVETNYIFAVNNGTLTIDKATLTVDVDDATREYGDINPAFTGSVSGWKNGQGLGNLTHGVSYTSAATQATNVGTAVITANTGLETNYTFVVNDGTLTIDKATLTVDVDDATREYGDINPVFTGSVSGWKNGQGLGDLANGIVYSTTATQSSGVGTAVISAQGGVEQNYDFNYVTGILTIDPATLTITLTIPNPTRQVGQANPSFGLSYSGFKLGQDNTSITAPTASTTANAGSAAGFYNITLSGGSAANYIFQHAPVLGQLQVLGAVIPPNPPVTNPTLPTTVVQVSQDNIIKTTTIKEASSTPAAVAFEESLVRNSDSIGQLDSGQGHKKFSTMLKGLLSIHPEVIRLFNLAQK